MKKKAFPDIKELDNYLEELINTNQERPSSLSNYFKHLTVAFYRLSFPVRNTETEETVLKEDMKLYDYLIERFENARKKIYPMKTYINKEWDVPAKNKMLKDLEKLVQELKTKREYITELLSYDISKEGLKEVKESNKRSRIALYVAIGSFLVALVSIFVSIFT